MPYVDPAWLDRGRLGQREREHAVLVAGLRLDGVYRNRQSEGSMESAFGSDLKELISYITRLRR